jgi:3-phosphoshikimate 1-carboxyvinyltransferase
MMGRVPEPTRTATELWDAPTATGPLHGTVAVPGSKSVTNRALVLAALADGPTRLLRPLAARDTRLMAAALRSLGVDVDEDEAAPPDEQVWTVRPRPLGGPAMVECGLAGTVMRFVPPLAALADGWVRFDGDERARARPMGPLLQALRTLHVPVQAPDGDRLPFAVLGQGGLRGGEVAVDASGSSQFVSGLLLAGCGYAEGLRVSDVGSSLPSQPHIAMTLAMLSERGVGAGTDPGGRAWRVAPGRPRGGEVIVEADVSNALPFAAAALATGGRIELAGFPTESVLQPVQRVLRLLESLGAAVSLDPVRGTLTVDGSGGLRAAGDLDMSAVGELVPVTAALAALAPGVTTIRGVAHLRGHETDRLAALAGQIAALGGDVTQTADGLAIGPARLHAGVFETFDDHRLATAAAVLGLAVPGVRVVDVATTGKTLPGFVDRWLGMLAA